jgi:hypothetical protein
MLGFKHPRFQHRLPACEGVSGSIGALYPTVAQFCVPMPVKLAMASMLSFDWPKNNRCEYTLATIPERPRNIGTYKA